MILAGTEITLDGAYDSLAAYATGHQATVRYYDYGGDTTSAPAGSNGVVMPDIARLVIINAGLAADDVATLLEPVDASLWDAVPGRC